MLDSTSYFRVTSESKTYLTLFNYVGVFQNVRGDLQHDGATFLMQLTISNSLCWGRFAPYQPISRQLRRLEPELSRVAAYGGAPATDGADSRVGHQRRRSVCLALACGSAAITVVTLVLVVLQYYRLVLISRPRCQSLSLVSDCDAFLLDLVSVSDWVFD